MNANRPSDALTQLILEVFRVNGGLLSAGDRLVADLGLTSARWQVLGAVALSPAAVGSFNLAAETVAAFGKLGITLEFELGDG